MRERGGGGVFEMSEAAAEQADTLRAVLIEHCGRIYQVLYDVADDALVQQHSWYIIKATSGRLYAVTRRDREVVFMHRLLAPELKRVAHLDGNTLNNTRRNLRRTRPMRANRTGLRNISVDHKRNIVSLRCVVGGKRVCKSFAASKYSNCIEGAIEAAVDHRRRLLERSAD